MRHPGPRAAASPGTCSTVIPGLVPGTHFSARDARWNLLYRARPSQPPNFAAPWVPGNEAWDDAAEASRPCIRVDDAIQRGQSLFGNAIAMSRDRLVPLIVAVALFMENMDSTVIATSLPAIALDIGTSPLGLKLAVTSYLLSLAVFIPASGWTADRFGARTVFRAAIAVFIVGSIGCALSSSLRDFVIARIVQGMGGAVKIGRA